MKPVNLHPTGNTLQCVDVYLGYYDPIEPSNMVWTDLILLLGFGFIFSHPPLSLEILRSKLSWIYY